MKHISIPMANSPIEVIESTQITPLVSYVKIKVLYVSKDENDFNRNETVITKDMARELGSNLPGSPIVGFYNTETGDFDTHTKDIEIRDGKIRYVDLTKPYGFVPPNAKVWFQYFLDDNSVEREYLLTEGYIWTGIYKESNKIPEGNNNQSMELKKVRGKWAKKENSNKQFFIINEGLIEKLCILGENVEPCFEGAQIKTEFSLTEDIREELQKLQLSMFSMMKEIQQIEGGACMKFEEYQIELDSSLWSNLSDYVNASYEDYTLVNTYTENDKTFMLLQDQQGNYSRLNWTENEAIEFDEELISLENFELVDSEQVNAIADFYKKKDNGSKEAQGEEESKDEKEKEKYELLEENYNLLEEKYNSLLAENENLKNENQDYRAFKLEKEKEEKQEMINSFYMLSDEDKKEVLENIDTYSLDDIEAKLSIICVRKRVNFNLEDEDLNKDMTFNLGGIENDNNDVPEWVQAVKECERSLNM